EIPPNKGNDVVLCICGAIGRNGHVQAVDLSAVGSPCPSGVDTVEVATRDRHCDADRAENLFTAAGRSFNDRFQKVTLDALQKRKVLDQKYEFVTVGEQSATKIHHDVEESATGDAEDFTHSWLKSLVEQLGRRGAKSLAARKEPEHVLSGSS